MVSTEIENKIPNSFLCTLGVIFVLLTIILLAISNFIGMQMWLIVLIMAIILSLISIIYLLINRRSLRPIINTYKKAPWSFIPLILGMFVLLEGIKQGRYIESFVTLLNRGNIIFNYGISSYLVSNLMNNQPMSMLYSVMLNSVPAAIAQKATFAAIIGSNIAVLLTPIGALAGLMWINLLHKHDLKLTFFGYIKKVLLIGVVTLTLSLLALMLMF